MITLLIVIPLLGLHYIADAGGPSTKAASIPSTLSTSVVPSNSSHEATKPITSASNNSTSDQILSLWDNMDMFVRALIVVACVSLIAVVYLAIRCLRHKHRMNKSRKYGLITSQEDKMELRPLGQEDDEDDLTVFDRTSATPVNPRSFDLTKNGMKVKDKAP